MERLSEAAVRGAAGVFENDPRIQVAYLFGSSCIDSKSPESDIDMAVVLSKLPEDMLDYHLDLTDRLTRPFGDRVDLAILNEARPLAPSDQDREGDLLP